LTQCQTCRFWEGVAHRYGEGLCRRNSPWPDTTTHAALWPVTLAVDWCGDFQPQPVKQKVEAPDALARPAP
jgi:hypothetical protein